MVLRSPHLPGPPLPPRAEAGYSMVVLIVAITVLNILVAAMLPLWSTQIRREKEEELIFRGWQYAEAIRVFQARTGGFPTKLEDLIKVKPRALRQLWKDPMTEDGKWQLIFEGQGDPLQPPPPNGRPGEKPDEPAEADENGREPQFGPREGETVQVGPIVGVRSRSNEKSMLALFGRQRYNEWAFTVHGLGGAQPGRPRPGGDPTAAANLQFSTRWLGRPMRFMNQTPGLQDGTLPQDRPPVTRKVDAGEFLGGAAEAQVMSDAGRPGALVIGASRLGQVPGVKGRGTVLRITFRAVAAGASELSFEGKALDAALRPVAVRTRPAMVEVTAAEPEPPPEAPQREASPVSRG